MDDAIVIRELPGYLSLRQVSDALSSWVEVMPLETLEQESEALSICQEIKQTIRASEEERKALVGPIKSKLREVDREYREARAPLERLEAQIKARVAEAVEAREKAKAEALAAKAAATAKAVASQGEERVQALQEANSAALAIPDPVKHQGVATRWVWEIVSVDLRAIPEKYLQIDRRAVLADAPNVPGVQFKKSVQVAVRSKK